MFELWRDSGWVPTLEATDWPRLTVLREKHDALANEFQEAERRLSALKRRFVQEDADASEAELDALCADEAGDSGAPVTEQERRETLLAAAEAASGEALSALCDHVAITVRETLEHRGEIEGLLGGETLMVPTADDPSAWNGRPVTEFEQESSRFGSTESRDRGTMRSWYRMTLQREGEQVLAQVEKAQRGAPAGSAA